MADQSVVFTVEGMSCMHCVKSIEAALGELRGVEKVIVDLKDRKVTVDFDSNTVNPSKLRDVIEEQGYKVQ